MPNGRAAGGPTWLTRPSNSTADHSPWDAQFYPDGIRGWLARFDAGRNGGLTLDQNFLVEFEDGVRPHQVRLHGGDASSDSFCFG